MIHEPGCDCGAYACELRAKNINLSYDASPTRRARRPFRKKVEPSWEKGRAGERRRDGSFMPYLTQSGRPIHVKEMGERRRELLQARRDQIVGPPPQE